MTSRISTTRDTPHFENALAMVATVVNLSYAVQRAPDALAQACIIGERFIASRQSASENSYGQDLCLEERIL